MHCYLGHCLKGIAFRHDGKYVINQPVNWAWLLLKSVPDRLHTLAVVEFICRDDLMHILHVFAVSGKYIAHIQFVDFIEGIQKSRQKAAAGS